MATQQKMLRIFRLIRLLNTRPYKTVQQLSKILDTTSRSVYRYLDFLAEVGYLIDKDAHNRYFIIHESDQKRDTLLDPDEAYYIQDTLQQVAPDHPLVAQITAKLNKIHSLIPIASHLPKVQAYRNVQKLGEAIQMGLRVRLLNYHSTSSQKIADRHVEPIHFDDDFAYLLAFDLDAQEQRQFKIDRIESVLLTAERIEGAHEVMPVDVFGFTGDNWQNAELRLSSIAYRLLIEEFPNARSFVKEEADSYRADIPVRDWRGLGRFILGLPGEITVLGPTDMIDYLRQEVARFPFLKKSN